MTLRQRGNDRDYGATEVVVVVCVGVVAALPVVDAAPGVMDVVAVWVGVAVAVWVGGFVGGLAAVWLGIVDVVAGLVAGGAAGLVGGAPVGALGVLPVLPGPAVLVLLVTAAGGGAGAAMVVVAVLILSCVLSCVRTVVTALMTVLVVIVCASEAAMTAPSRKPTAPAVPYFRSLVRRRLSRLLSCGGSSSQKSSFGSWISLGCAISSWASPGLGAGSSLLSSWYLVLRRVSCASTLAAAI